jgi:hypothetical protein
MLQAHSILWHYLWVAPNFLSLFLAAFLWKRGLHKKYPTFVAFIVIASIEQLTIYSADIIPSIGAKTWWMIFWAGLVLEGLMKFAVISEIFVNVFNSYSSIASLGKLSIRGCGVLLVLGAAVAAGYSPEDSRFGIVSGAHLLQQTIYLIETGLLVFIFAFAGYFRLRPPRAVTGIALGLGTSACVHLATWSLVANAGLSAQARTILDLINMATYHVCVLIWFYYLLVPGKVVAKSAVPLPENDLEVWNRELERLLP